jgi:hypothetical protein
MCFGRQLVRVVVVGLTTLLVVSVLLSCAAMRLPGYANYVEFWDGWHMGVRQGAGWNGAPAWWDARMFVGQFPDRGKRLPPSRDMLSNPYRWPDLSQREARLIWPLLTSVVGLPGISIARQYLARRERRGFSAICDRRLIDKRYTHRALRLE